MISLSEIYKNFSGEEVLNGVSFEIKQGEFVTLIGRIGSGKSTVINLICGLIKQDRGQIFIDNMQIDFTSRSHLKDIGFLLSVDYLIDDFSTILYWESIGKLFNFKREYIRERIKFLLDLCEISDPKKPIGQLSSGNKMLVKIGTMLINKPKTLIIDEPFSHLDISGINKIEKILQEYNKNGNTIFMATHYPESIFRISNKLMVLENGIIKEHLYVNNFNDYDSFRNSLSAYFKKS